MPRLLHSRIRLAPGLPGFTFYSLSDYVPPPLAGGGQGEGVAATPATPLAAAAAALIVSANPALTGPEVRDVLCKSARKIDLSGGHYVNGYSSKYGYGCIDAEAAVEEALRRRTRSIRHP